MIILKDLLESQCEEMAGDSQTLDPWDTLEVQIPTTPEDLIAEQEEPEARKEPEDTKAEQMLKLFEAESVDFFPDRSGIWYATFYGEGHSETHPAKGDSFKLWVSRRFYLAKRKSISPGQIDDAILLACALADNTPRDTHVRVAGTTDDFYIDLGTHEWNIVHVNREGWEVQPYTGNPCFTRPAGMKPLAFPCKEGSLAHLRPFVNGSQDEFVRVTGFLLSALRPRGPYPLLVLGGAQGSAKTTLAECLIRLVDNRDQPSATLPQKEDDLLVVAQGQRILSFDNISSVSTDISNALCRLATGAGISKRKLYTDKEMVSFGGARPVILNGIGALVGRADLADRAIFVHLEKLRKFSTMEALEARWEKASPLILGGLLNALVACIRGKDKISSETTEHMRMMDSALWVEAAATEGSVPWNPGDFTRLVNEAKGDADDTILEESPVASYILNYMAANDTLTTTGEDLVKNILDKLLTPEARKYAPGTVRALSKALEELSPALESRGITFDKNRRIGNKRHYVFVKK